MSLRQYCVSRFDRAGIVVAAMLGATWGLVVKAPDMKPNALIFVLCPPALIVWGMTRIVHLDGLPSWAILPYRIFIEAAIVIGNALLYGFLMKLWNSLPDRLRSRRPSSPRRTTRE